MRRSGVRPAVKRWKFACVTLRRAASGHIAATQLVEIRRRLADRARPSSRDGRRRRPRRSRAAARCAVGAGGGLRLRRWRISGRRRCCRKVRDAVTAPRLRRRPGRKQQRRRDHDRAPLSHRRIAVCRPVASVAVPKHPVSEGPVTVSNSLTKAEILFLALCCARAAKRPAPHIRLCSRLQTGYQRAIKRTFRVPRKAPDIPMKIRKAVFPVAGLGTRVLPATKAMPKEMLTIVDKPLIQYVVRRGQGSRHRAFHLRHRAQQGRDRGSFRPACSNSTPRSPRAATRRPSRTFWRATSPPPAPPASPASRRRSGSAMRCGARATSSATSRSRWCCRTNWC